MEDNIPGTVTAVLPIDGISSTTKAERMAIVIQETAYKLKVKNSCPHF
jgi:hypothetical protein